jgi:uncharacterized OsmC-like protein
MHAPTDDIVGIDNARVIFEAARHPKSFVALDGADHLLTRRADAEYVASVLAAWARRYLAPEAVAVPQQAETPLPPGTVRVTEAGGHYRQTVTAGTHRFAVDEPAPLGADTGPNPYDLLLTALGSCTSITVRMYAERKGWPLEKVTVSLRHDRVHAEDCEHCDTAEGRVERIDRQLFLEGPLSAEQRDRLLQIADMCPVHRTLTGKVVVRTELR